MPHMASRDGTRLYYEEAGAGRAVIFVHEYAGDFRTWEPQMRHFARSHRCITHSQRGYPPSDVPTDGATRQTQKNKDPRGFAEFARMLSEHSKEGHALTMLHLQAKRPTLWEIESELTKFSVPLLVVVGDEDDWCLDPSVFLKRTVPTAGLNVIPRSGHTITSEEPAAFNAALAELFAAAEAGRWLAHKAAP